MPQNHSMDIVSEIDLQEADNAVNQATKEINQRYDLKDSKLKVNAQIQDQQIRVQGTKIDDLQAIIKMVKEADLDFPTQFVNFK